MRIILTTQLQDRNRLVSVQVEETMDERNPKKIQCMKDALADFFPHGQTPPVEVQCLAAPAEKSLDSSSGKQKLISKDQLKYLRDLLRKNHISETQCCQENNVSCLNQLSNDATRALIDELK